MKFGLIPNEPIDDYHASSALSKSKLDDFRRLPLLFHKKYIEQAIPRPPLTADFRIGLGSHALVLEGDEAYASRFIVLPQDAPDDLRRYRNAAKPSPATVASIKWWDEFDDANRGKTVIPATENALNQRIRLKVHSHPLASLLLARGAAELTFRVATPNFAIQCRPDWYNDDGASPALVELLRQYDVKMEVGEPYACDLKTAPSLSELDYRNFTRNFEDFGYYRQGPFYRGVMRDVLKKDVRRFFYIVAEKQEPFEVAVFLADQEADEIGWLEIEQDLQALNQCYETGVWPGVPQGLQTIRLSERFHFIKKRREERAA